MAWRLVSSPSPIASLSRMQGPRPLLRLTDYQADQRLRDSLGGRKGRSKQVAATLLPPERTLCPGFLFILSSLVTIYRVDFLLLPFSVEKVLHLG